MIFNGALSKLATCSRTGIYTLESCACQIEGAVVIAFALPSTSVVTVWIAFIALGAETSTCAIIFAAFCVRSTW